MPIYDPIMLAELMANMPETRRRGRRASKLRGQDFEDLQTALSMMGGVDPVGEVTGTPDFSNAIPNTSLLGGADPIGAAVPGSQDYGFGAGVDPFDMVAPGSEDYGYGPGVSQWENVQSGIGMAGGVEPQGAMGPADYGYGPGEGQFPNVQGGSNTAASQLAGTLGIQAPQEAPPMQPEAMAPEAAPPLEQPPGDPNAFPAVNVEDMLRGTMQLPAGQGAVAGAAPGELAGGEVPPEIMEEDQAAKMAIAEEEVGRPAFDPESGLPDEVIRMHMALLDAPKVAGLSDDVDNENFTISTKTDDKGNVWLIQKHGPPKPAGFKQDFNAKTFVTPDGKYYSIGSSGSGRGVSLPVFNGFTPPALGEDEEYIEVPPPAAGQTAAAPQGRTTPDGWMLNAGGISLEAGGLPEARIKQMGDFFTRMQKEGATPEAFDEVIKKFEAENEIIRSGRQPGGLSPVTAGGVAGPAMGGVATPAPVGSNAPGTQLTQTPEARVKGDVAYEQKRSEARVEAQATLGKTLANGEAGIRAIDTLRADKAGLKAITKNGGISWGNAPEMVADPLITMFGGEDASRGFTQWETVKASAFIDAFENLRGGGQITEAEGTKAEKAKTALSRRLTAEQLDENLGILRDVIAKGMARAKARAAGDFSGDNALEVTGNYRGPNVAAGAAAAAAAAGPAGATKKLSDAELLKMYGD